MESVAKFAHPSGMAGRITDNERIIRHMFGYHSPRPNKGKTTDIVSAYDGGVSANAGTPTNTGLGILASAVDR
jgi:hypothetical protein